jgi:hypothetical protein
MVKYQFTFQKLYCVGNIYFIAWISFLTYSSYAMGIFDDNEIISHPERRGIVRQRV